MLDFFLENLHFFVIMTCLYIGLKETDKSDLKEEKKLDLLDIKFRDL